MKVPWHYAEFATFVEVVVIMGGVLQVYLEC